MITIDETVANSVKNLSDIIDEPDDVFELNMAYCGANFELEALQKSNVWKEIHRSDINTVWLERIIASESNYFIFRVAFSNNGYLRVIVAYQFAPDNNPKEIRTALSLVPQECIKILKEELDNVFVKSAPATIQLELENVVKGLSRNDFPADMNKNNQQFLIWAHEINQRRKTSRETAIRVINGMLRFGDFCPYGYVLAFAGFSAIKLHYRKAAALLTKMALEKTDSRNDAYWSYIGCTLDILGDIEGAFNCLVLARNLNKLDDSIQKNVWIEGEILIAQYVRNRLFDKLLPVAEILMNSVTEHIDIRSQADVICTIGMTYESKNDLDEAGRYYAMALDKMKSQNNTEAKPDDDDSDEDVSYPLAWQSLWRLKVDSAEIREKYFDAQTKSYPKSPMEIGFEGCVPVEYVSGNTHGSHWKTLLPEFEMLMPFLSKIVTDGTMFGKGANIPLAELGFCKFFSSFGMTYQPEGEESSPTELMTIVGQRIGEEQFLLATGFPKLKDGVSVEFEIICVQEWQNGIEATAEFQLNDEQRLCFFLPNYYRDRKLFKAHHKFSVKLAGFGYSMSKFEKATFNIESGPLLEEEKVKLRNEGKPDDIKSVTLNMADDFGMFSNGFNDNAVDDISYVGKVESVKPFKFLGNECFEVIINLNKEHHNGIQLPVYIGNHKLKEYVPQTGDIVEGCLWLQGIIGEDLGEVKQETAPLTEDEAELDLGLLRTIRGTEVDLVLMAERALKITSKASEIYRWEDPIEHDPDFVCCIENKNHFIKVIHGFFDDEKAFIEEVQKNSKPEKLFDKYPLEYVAVGGSKLTNEYNNIHYLGFEELRQIQP